MEKLLKSKQANEKAKEVSISSLKWIKWIWEKTINTLIENWIHTVEDFKKYSEQELYVFLTPVQFHQINLYIKTNNI